MSPKLVIIAAASENNVLGIDNDLPWHLPDDFKRFKKLTTGHKIIMGRKTLESFPKALPNREHLVITRDPNYKPKFECHVFNSLKAALDYSQQDAQSFIIGGGEVYRQAMDFATDIELTRVHATIEGDTFFPDIDLTDWELINEEFHPKDDRHKYAFTFQTYKRKIS